MINHLIKKFDRKGFTLIELLAVIVILAIILVVTIPTVLSSMDKAKENSLENATNSVQEWFTKQYESAKLGIITGNADKIYSDFGGVTNQEKLLGKDILEAAGINNAENNINTVESKVKIHNNKICVQLTAKESGQFWNNNNNIKFSSGCGNVVAEKVKNLFNPNSTVNSNGIDYQYDNVNKLMKDVGGNIRYYGTNPNNYIYFNCDDYSNQSSSTCEVWRIIGIFNGRIKIIRTTSIGYYSWDTSTSGVNEGKGKKEWTQADLMKLLNPGYESETVGGSLFYNSASGTCYNGTNNLTVSCNFNNKGIKNDETRNMIATTTWSLGETNIAYYPDKTYLDERNVTNSLVWNGKIGLPYLSDYGYAADLSQCNQKLNSYNNQGCVNTNWLYNIITKNGSHAGWIQDTIINNNTAAVVTVWGADSPGIAGWGTSLSSAYNTIPTLYLNSNIAIKDGNGTISLPYVIER